MLIRKVPDASNQEAGMMATAAPHVLYKPVQGFPIGPSAASLYAEALRVLHELRFAHVAHAGGWHSAARPRGRVESGAVKGGACKQAA